MIGSVTKNGGRREMETYDRVCDQNGGRREMETYDRICDQKRRDFFFGGAVRARSSDGHQYILF